MPWKSFYVDNHVGAVVRACNYHTRAPRHVREHLTTETAQTPAASMRHLVTDRLQLTVVWRSCCSRREAAEISKQRRPGHLSAAQMCSCQTAVSSMAACPTAYPVQNSGHHAQGSVNFRSAVHLRTPTTPSDDVVSAVHRLSASLCAMDTH